MSDCPMCLDRGVIRVIVSRSATMAISCLKDCPVCGGPEIIRWYGTFIKQWNTHGSPTELPFDAPKNWTPDADTR